MLVHRSESERAFRRNCLALVLCRQCCVSQGRICTLRYHTQVLLEQGRAPEGQDNVIPGTSPGTILLFPVPTQNDVMKALQACHLQCNVTTRGLMVAINGTEAEDCIEAFKGFSRVSRSWPKVRNIIHYVWQDLKFLLDNNTIGIYICECIQQVANKSR